MAASLDSAPRHRHRDHRDPVTLLAHWHSQSLMALSSAAKLHRPGAEITTVNKGLTVLKGVVSNRIRNKMQKLEIAYSVLRHLTADLCDTTFSGMLRDIDAYMDANSGVDSDSASTNVPAGDSSSYSDDYDSSAATSATMPCPPPLHQCPTTSIDLIKREETVCFDIFEETETACAASQTDCAGDDAGFLHGCVFVDPTHLANAATAAALWTLSCSVRTRVCEIEELLVSDTLCAAPVDSTHVGVSPSTSEGNCDDYWDRCLSETKEVIRSRLHALNTAAFWARELGFESGPPQHRDRFILECEEFCWWNSLSCDEQDYICEQEDRYFRGL